MFDIGFWEISVIAVVALLVIGPERLPGVARQAGMWLGRIRGFVSTVQADINQEISKSEELKRLLEEQSKIKEIHEIIETSQEPVRALGEDIEKSLQGQGTNNSAQAQAVSSAADEQAHKPAISAGSVPRAQPVAPKSAPATSTTASTPASTTTDSKAKAQPAPGTTRDE